MTKKPRSTATKRASSAAKAGKSAQDPAEKPAKSAAKSTKKTSARGSSPAPKPPRATKTVAPGAAKASKSAAKTPKKAAAKPKSKAKSTAKPRRSASKMLKFGGIRPGWADLDPVTRYAVDVLDGEIVAGPHVRNACRRHLDDLRTGGDRGLVFDLDALDRVLDFFPRILRLSEGQFEGRPFDLDPSQAFIVGSIFAWKKANGRRRFRRAFIEQGKGNGKSPLAGGIGLYGLTADQEPGAQVYSAAAKRDQAAILFHDACAMVRKAPLLAKRLKISGPEGKEFNIAHVASGSFFRPVSREAGKTGSGPRPHIVLADEVHEMASGAILETLERGFKFRRNPLLFMITNSGSDRNSVAWQEHEHACRVAAGSFEPLGSEADYVGEAVDDETFAFVCALDEGDDPLEDPGCWIKANPLLGKTIDEDYLAGVVRQAKQMPGKLNGILRLHFCVWTEADVAWTTRSAISPLMHDFDPVALHKGASAWVGLDLSGNRDMTAVATIVKTGTVDVQVQREGETVTIAKPTFDAWIEAWTPGDNIEARELRDKLPYRVWRDRGFLNAVPGLSIPYVHVAQYLADLDRDFEIVLAAYDRFAFSKFEEEAAQVGLSIPFAEHPQGGVKKGKPTDAMKEAAKAADPPREPQGLWMPGSVRLLEDAILEGRIRLQFNPVLMSALLSAVAEADRWGNHWLSKLRSTNKIDAAVALAMAIGAAEAIQDAPGGGLDAFLASLGDGED